MQKYKKNLDFQNIYSKKSDFMQIIINHEPIRIQYKKYAQSSYF